MDAEPLEILELLKVTGLFGNKHIREFCILMMSPFLLSHCAGCILSFPKDKARIRSKNAKIINILNNLVDFGR